MNELQTFANGDTNYIAKHNSNYANIHAAVSALEANLSAQVAAASGPGSAFTALFGPTGSLVGSGSYVPTGSGDTLTVAAGFAWKPSIPMVVQNATNATLLFTGLTAGTYYISADNTGAPVRNASAGPEDLYSVVWTGTAFGAITRLAPVVWGPADETAALNSTALAQTFLTLDARLEAGEAASAAGALARVWQTGRLSKDVSGGADVTLTNIEANNTLLNLTGTLTANINVIVPLGVAPRLWVVTNNTTGAFTVTVKGATGTGVAVAQGGVALLSQDGTNVISAGGGAGTVQSVNTKTPDGSGAVTLTASDIGADAIGSASAAITAHDAEADPHPQYLTQSEADSRYAATASGLADGDKGDIVVSGGGTNFAIDGSVLSTFGRTLIDDADPATARTTLGLGTAATLASDTDVALSANSDTKIPTQKAVKAYVDAIATSGATDVMVFKGVIDCSTNPNYPAADAGNLYKISAAGKIGGASGVNVEAGDTIYCIADSTASGTQAAVGASWVIAQANLDAAVTGPSSATDSAIALFNGAGGRVVKNSGITISTDGAFAANSDVLVPTQRAVKSYITNALGSGSGTTGGFGGAEAAFSPPAVASFTQTNFGTTGTATVAENFTGADGTAGVRLRERGDGLNNNHLRSLLKGAPGGSTWTLIARLRSNTLLTNWQALGITLTDSISGKYIFYGWAYDAGPFAYITWAGANTYTSASLVCNPSGGVPHDAWFGFYYDGTNLNFLYSRDGNYFVTLKRTGLTDYLANAPSAGGICINPNCSGNNTQQTVLECLSFYYAGGAPPVPYS